MSYTAEPNATLKLLCAEIGAMTPELRKAALYLVKNHQNIAFSTVREIAKAANVKPNTMVRMARQAGFEGFEDLREHFRQEIRSAESQFSDRARGLQELQKRGAMGELYAEMAESALRNVEATFAATNEKELQAAAQKLWQSRHVFTLGVGVNHANASNFTYLASTGMTDFHAIPRSGSTPVDDLAWADERDSLIAITCSPYRTEVVGAVEAAKKQGVNIVALSDSQASPIIRAADYGFVVSTQTPQFFPSSVSITALLETLLSFVVSISSQEVTKRVEKFHQRRHQLGLYQEDYL